MYFSAITQRTLSAFHRAGIDASLLDEIESVKAQISSPKPLVLKDVVLSNKSPPCTAHSCSEYKDTSCFSCTKHDRYTRYFENGYTDVVCFEDVFKDVYKDNQRELSEISELLDGEVSPISKMGMGAKIVSINVARKRIERQSECIFFL